MSACSRSRMSRVGLLLLLVLGASSAFPAEQQQRNIPSDIRSRIITKHDFINRRGSKSQPLPPRLPEPFIVSTELNVRDAPGVGGSRRGRTWTDASGATVVEGVRVPDDESDRVTWRNGRVINNVFVPYVDSDEARSRKERQEKEQQQQQSRRQPRQGFPKFPVNEPALRHIRYCAEIALLLYFFKDSR